MTFDSDTCYRAVVARDPRFDGRFFTGVTSTGIYCRPVCPARTPARANMRFFAHAGAAEAAGFRACRRCRPETSPGSPEWNVRADLAARAVRLIADGYVDAHGISGLAARLAVTQRHLHRLLVAELGTGPLALARTARLQTARRLLAETAMPITDVAFASGFSSVRQFNASVLESSGRTPSELRARARRTGPGGAGARDMAGTPGTWLTLRLACREPFDAAAWLGFLAARAIPGVEQVSAERYTRTIRTATGPGIIELIPRPGQGHVLLRARLTRLGAVAPVVGRARRLLDADADPAAIGAALAADDLIAPLVRARPGLRVPGAYDGFELAVRAVLGQQVSVAAASTFAGRLASRYGVPLPPDATTDVPAGAITEAPAGAITARAAGLPGLSVVFPSPEMLADADLAGLGLTTARQRTLRALAGVTASGRLVLDPGADPAEVAARLAELPGIGPWTIGYILMRSAADPDAFPEADLGLRRGLARLGAPPGHAARWRPWRAYAAMHLWSCGAAGRVLAGPARHSRVRELRSARCLTHPSPPAPSTAGTTGTGPTPAVPATARPDPARTAPAGPADTRPTPATPTPARPTPAGLSTAVTAGTVLATVVDTPIGPLSLLTHGGQLIAGGFTAQPAVMHARLAPPLRALTLEPADPADLPWLAKPVGAYFDGDLRALDEIPVHQPGTPSRQRLWAALRAVPPGTTVSYTQLAARAGNPRAPRAAGAACAYNLIAPVVPCHRALRTDGSLGGYYYGLDRKTWLLRHEGARPR